MKDGSKYEGAWKNGQQHGVGKLEIPNEEAIYGIWAYGIIVPSNEKEDLNRIKDK